MFLRSTISKAYPWIVMSFVGISTFIVGVYYNYQTSSSGTPLNSFITEQWLSILCWGLISIISSWLALFLSKVYRIEHLLDERMYRVLHLYPHLLLADKVESNSHSVSEALRELIENHEDKRTMALEFAIETFRDILKHGFIAFDSRIKRYVEYINMGISCSSISIFASCKVRPFWFLLNPSEDPSGSGIYQIGPEERGAHLLMLKRARIENKVRLVVLTETNIELIIADAILACEQQSPPRPPKEELNDLPEIRWFTNIACNHPRKVKLLWTKDCDTLSTMGLKDQIVFDGEISLQFEFAREASLFGHITLTWRSIISNTLSEAISKYIIATKEIRNNRSSTSIPFHDIATHVCFIDLLDTFGVKSSRSYPHIIKASTGKDFMHELNIEETISLKNVYEYLLNKLNNGTIVHSESMLVRIPNSDKEPRGFQCDWKNNSQKILQS